MMKKRLSFRRSSAVVSVVLATVSLIVRPSHSLAASWAEPGWSYRRPVDVQWNAETGRDGDLATVEFYTDAHALPKGQDIRVATDEGRPVASHVLRMGPGDRASIVFALARHVQRYYVYFGNNNPAAPKPALADVVYHSGLLLETRALPPNMPVENARQLQDAWDKATDPVGAAMIDSAFMGTNPFGPEERTISKITGTFSAPLEGEYAFAMAVDDRAELWIDGRPVLFATDGPSDARYHVKVPLAKGNHDLTLYHANLGGDGRVALAWLRPDQTKFEIISPAFFGNVARGAAGPMEQIRKEFVADFSVQHVGECFYADHYSHRYKFTAYATKNDRLKIEWDFGDGQTADAPAPEHVYLVDKTYPVKLTFRIGSNEDSQTNRLEVRRDYEHIANPPADDAAKQSAIVARYDLARLPEDWLPWAVLLHQRANDVSAMFAAADRLASLPRHSSPASAVFALHDATRAAESAGKIDPILSVWGRVPAESDLQPQAAMDRARLLMWRAGDFAKAVESLEPFAAKGGTDLKILYADALVLAGRAEQGRKLLREIPPAGNAGRRAAISGAQARTIEFYITQKDADAGEQAWRRWQELYPEDFLEGYSVLLQTRLMELQNAAPAAAKLAEAFANAVPTSPYAPQLLDRASKLLSAADPVHSADLRKLLKERYPEDPLSQ